MFVVIDRNGAPILFEHVRTLLEELVTGIENLSLFVAWIISVLDNDQHGIYGELVAAATQCFRNRRVNGEPEFFSPSR